MEDDGDGALTLNDVIERGMEKGPSEPARQDGETWEEYSRRLEKRIALQRDHLRQAMLHAKDGNRQTRKRMDRLEQLCGVLSLRCHQKDDAIRALVAQVRAGTAEAKTEVVERWP